MKKIKKYKILFIIPSLVGGGAERVIINILNHLNRNKFIPYLVLFEKKGIYLIMDDIYQLLVFNGIKPANPFDYVTDFSENSKLIIINGVSKAYAMTCFRIGWAVGNKTLIKMNRRNIGERILSVQENPLNY